jgi:hypothetical protein
LLTVSRTFINVANSVLWRIAIILKVNKVNLFVSSVLFIFWYYSPSLLDTPRTSSQCHTKCWPPQSITGYKSALSRKLHRCPFFQKT